MFVIFIFNKTEIDFQEQKTLRDYSDLDVSMRYDVTEEGMYAVCCVKVS